MSGCEEIFSKKTSKSNKKELKLKIVKMGLEDLKIPISHVLRSSPLTSLFRPIMLHLYLKRVILAPTF